MARDGTLLHDCAASLGRVLVGYAGASAAGLLLGAATALSGPWGSGVRTVLELLRPIPPIAWVPLAILWFGLGDGSAWFIVFAGAFFPIYIQVAWALGHCPEPYLELARGLGASDRLTLLRVRLPAAAPQVADGLRTGLGLAWTSVIAAELVGAQSGLGYRIQMHRLVLETEGVIVGMACIGVLGFGMSALARRVERRLLPWA
jgi:NitT/TauT family transport system permease protein/sulfonate transport system permease protein